MFTVISKHVTAEEWVAFAKKHQESHILKVNKVESSKIVV